jgi:hypothetical protein
MLLLAIAVSAHTLNSLFEKDNPDLRERKVQGRGTEDDRVRLTEGRLLQTPSPTRAAMRIELDTTMFSGAIQAGQNGAASTTTTKLNFVLRAMLVAQTFYQTRLQVGQEATIYAPVTCVDFTTPLSAQSAGFASADLVIFVRYVTDAGLTYGATGKSCLWNADATPDMQLRSGRPTVGRIIFNTYQLVDQESSLTNRLFQSITSTALHETMHILGFDSTLYSGYLDPTTGSPYASGVTTAGTVNVGRPATTFMTTPYVLAWAKAFFGCPTLTGMPLENEDGTGTGAGSHW